MNPNTSARLARDFTAAHADAFARHARAQASSEAAARRCTEALRCFDEAARKVEANIAAIERQNRQLASVFTVISALVAGAFAIVALAGILTGETVGIGRYSVAKASVALQPGAYWIALASHLGIAALFGFIAWQSWRSRWWP